MVCAQINHAAKGMEQVAIGAAGALIRAQDPPLSPSDNPGNDPEVKAILAEIRELSPQVRNTQGMVRLQEVLLRLLTLILAKSPVKSWTGLSTAVESLHRMILFTRRVEADMPPHQDPIAMRQDAARQMMREIGEVLTKDEQQALADILQKASDRLGRTGKATIDLVPEQGGNGFGIAARPQDGIIIPAEVVGHG
jgi:hypothetical protein